VGVDLKHFSPEQLSVGKRTKSAKGKAQNFKAEAVCFCFCNRSWEPRYGVDVLARAFAKVANQREDVSLLLLNGGSQTNVIRQILMKGGVLDRVQYGGQVSQIDLPRWYHMADLFISPSHIDGSSVSLMEALACGVACAGIGYSRESRMGP